MCGNLGLGHISRSKRARRCIWLLDVCEGGVSSELVQEKNYMKKELIFVDKIIPDEIKRKGLMLRTTFIFPSFWGVDG